MKKERQVQEGETILQGCTKKLKSNQTSMEERMQKERNIAHLRDAKCMAPFLTNWFVTWLDEWGTQERE